MPPREFQNWCQEYTSATEEQPPRRALLLPQWLRYHELMSFADTVVLFVLALLLFGPKKLPVIARQIGKALNEFKRASNEFKAQIESEITQLEYQERQKKEREEAQKILPPPQPAESVESERFSPAVEPPKVDHSDSAELNSMSKPTDQSHEINSAATPNITNA